MEVLGKVECERCGSDSEVMSCLDNNRKYLFCIECINKFQELEEEKDAKYVPFSIFLADFKVSRR